MVIRMVACLGPLTEDFTSFVCVCVVNDVDTTAATRVY